jgi:ATP-dependent Clp endopeptidase proteolytic subunit ClpP
MINIDINGPIISNDSKWIYDWFEIEATCPKDVISKIREANGADIEVAINSGGGDVYAGAEIYTTLKEYSGNVVGKIVGIAASAASVVAMGCKKLKMTPVGQMMIHKAALGTYGNHNKMEHAAEVLKSHDEGIVNAYKLKTGMDSKKILELMDKETYFNAQEALKLGLVDEIMFDDGLKLTASVGQAEIPPEIINKMRNMKASAEGAFFIPTNTADPEPDPDPPLENGEELTPQPVSDTALQAQQEYFKNQKLKLMGGITNV